MINGGDNQPIYLTFLNVVKKGLRLTERNTVLTNDTIFQPKQVQGIYIQKMPSLEMCFNRFKGIKKRYFHVSRSR